MDIFTGRSFAAVLLDWAINGELVFRDDYDECWFDDSLALILQENPFVGRSQLTVC